jgi:ABC-type oligopeptide transport system substrate-binding subunit
MTNTENNNGNNILLLAIVLALLAAIFLTSCGSRKVAKSETKEQEQKTEKITLETETRVTDNTKIVDTSTTDEIEIIPIDNTLPITVNGKKYTNSRIKWKKKKNNISVVKDVKVQHNEQKSELKTVKRDLIIERKVIDRKQSYWWLLWFLLLIPAYYLWRKYKGYFI